MVYTIDVARFKDQAICIRHIDWSETSQIVTLMTQTHGLVRGLAKGSKRTSPGALQRYSGGIELLTQGQVLAHPKPAGQLATITEWDLQQPLFHLRNDLTAHQLGLFGADLTGAMLADHDPHPMVFDALLRFLQSLKNSKARHGALLRFQWVMLSDCGFEPSLERDIHSDQTLAKNVALWFDPRGGGLTAQEPSARDKQKAKQTSLAGRSKYQRIHVPEGLGPWRVSPDTVRLLRRVADKNQEPAKPLRAPSTVIERANRLLCVYTRALLDRQLPTMSYILDAD
jgi:DNA repair protein RecO (recombination protein O)